MRQRPAAVTTLLAPTLLPHLPLPRSQHLHPGGAGAPGCAGRPRGPYNCRTWQEQAAAAGNAARAHAALPLPPLLPALPPPAEYPKRLRKLLLTPEREVAVELALLRDNGEASCRLPPAAC